VCGDCQDNDGNGLTDFEDPACCQQLQRFDMTLSLGRIRPMSPTTSRLRLRSMLARSGLADIDPMREDVFLQIRPAGGSDVLCAHFPATKFRRYRGAFRFQDRLHTVEVARSVDDVIIKVRGDGSVGFRTNSKEAKLASPPANNLQVTVGIRDPSAGDVANRCSTMTESFRTGRRGALLVP
jgi:hypothetical protein